MFSRGKGIGLIASCLLVLLTACSTPKHTNTMIFGTNTKFGLDIGVDATSTTPTLSVGYKRQEAVWLPLVANKDSEGNAYIAKGKLSLNGECLPLKKDETADCGGIVRLAGEEGANRDTYSAFASFGLKFVAEGAPTTAKAEGGIAQYFATGLAARKLAEHGGAALVNTDAKLTEGRFAADEISDLLENYWMPKGKVNKNNEKRIDDCMAVESISITKTELLIDTYAKERRVVAKCLGLI